VDGVADRDDLVAERQLELRAVRLQRDEPDPEMTDERRVLEELGDDLRAGRAGFLGLRWARLISGRPGSRRGRSTMVIALDLP
jgi:hypothetical protein